MSSLSKIKNRYYLPNPRNEGDVFKQFQFGSGENHLQVINPSLGQAEIMFRYTGDQSIIQLIMLTDAIRREGTNEIDLYIPYFPGARQDRVCNQGEPLSVKVYADLINQQRYRNVYIFDPHSDVVTALLDKVCAIKNHHFIKDVVKDIGSEITLISPDAGSNKKIFALAAELGGFPVVRADKIRDVKTGKIVDTEVFCDDLYGSTALIVDDICAGGRTFIELAKKLKTKNCKKIVLAVSHFEGTADQEQLFNNGIDELYTTNSLHDSETNDFLRQKDIWQYMTTNILGEEK